MSSEQDQFLIYPAKCRRGNWLNLYHMYRKQQAIGLLFQVLCGPLWMNYLEHRPHHRLQLMLKHIRHHFQPRAQQIVHLGQPIAHHFQPT
jgi:hypothetical protein